MTSILAIGILVAAVLLASAPIYARATSDLGVVFIVRDALRDDPGVRVELRETELSTESAVANLRFVEDRIDARLGWFRESQGRIVESANFRIHVDGTDLVDTTTRGRVFTLQGWEAHVQLIEGELPASVGADEPVQVALHQLGAQIAGLGVGDTFRLVEYFDTCQRVIALELDVAPPEVTCFAGATVSHSVPAVLTAIIAPIEEGDPFWYPSHKVFFVPAGAMIRQTGLVVQMFMPESSLIEGIAGRFPAYTGTVTWNVQADPELMNSSSFERIQQDILDFHAELQGHEGSVASGLTTTLDDFARSQGFQQVPLTILLLEIAGIALFYTCLVAAIVVERQSEEIALFRGRGASVGQVLGIYFIEGLTIGIPIALTAPFLAAAATSLLGLTPVFADVSGGELLPTVVEPLAFVLAGVAVLVSIATVLIPAAVVARLGAMSQKRALARPELSIIQRYYLDFGLVLFAVLMFWELNERGSVFEPSSTGGITSDPILLASPALTIAAAAAMIVRFYPMILRLFLGTVTRVSGATLLVGMWQVVRSPSQYTRLALLLMMAVALGTFAASYRSTTQRSYEDRARFEAGADLRGTHSTRMIYGSGAELDENVEELAGVAAASATMRITGVQAFGGSASRQVTVLGVERDLADVAWYREDFADVPVHDLLQPLGGPEGFADVTLPEGTVGIELWVDTEVLRSDLTVTVRVRGGAGQYSTFELIDIDQHGWRKGEVLFEKPGVELQQPLSIVAVMLTPPSRRIRSADNAIFIDDIAAFNADGERTLVEDFEGGREWSGIPHPDQRAESLRISGENVHGGGHAARIGFVEEATKGRRGMFPSHVNIPLPVVASRRFVQESGIDVGETTFIEFSGGAVPVVVRAVYELFPTLGAVDGASIIANRDHLEDWGNTFQVLPGPLLGPNEVWVSLDEGGDADAVAGQLVHREYGNFNRTTSVSEALGRIQSNPLIAASGQGILLIAYVAVMGLVGAALLVSLWMAVQRRKVEFAVLRALGLARRQIFALLAFEYSIVGIVGLVTGGYLGRVVGRRMLSFLDVTETGGAVEPDFVLRTDWTFVAAGGVGVFVVFLAALLFATRVLAKMSEAEALRIE